MSKFEQLCDANVRANSRAVPGPDASPAEIEGALRAAGLMEPMPLVEDAYRIGGRTVVVEAPAGAWYVATFAPRLHDKVKRRCYEAGWIFTCPKLKEWQLVKHPKPGEAKKVAVERPLFGTYGFLRSSETHNLDWMAVERVDGLGAIVRRPMTREPVTVPTGEVERFARLEAEGVFDATRSRPPKVKRLDRIVVTSGLFVGVRALVEMTMGERVRVLMDMLGVVEMPMDAVELAS